LDASAKTTGTPRARLPRAFSVLACIFYV
jgi:hypothetical protein